MQFQTMREFLVLAETLNYLTAADQLYISQSTLSKHISDMEKELDVPLFKRSTRQVQLTECGMRLVPYAQRAVTLQDEYTEEIENYKEWAKNQLVIECISHCNVIDLGKMNLDFNKEHPEITISIFTTEESEDYVSAVKDETCDFCISREEKEIPDDGLTRILLCEDPMYVFLPKDHPLADSELISLQQLKHDTFLFGAEKSLSYSLAMEACQQAGLHPNIIYRGDRPQALNYLARGLGVALMFGSFTGRSFIEKNIVRVPFEPKVTANINLVYKKEHLSEAGKTFLNFVKNYSFENG